MILGFDLDGCICNQDSTQLQIMHELKLETEKILEPIYYSERELLLDPRKFLHDGDEYHIITGRHEGLKTVTENWVKKWCPEAKTLNVCGGRPWYDFEKRPGENNVECWQRWFCVAIQNKVELIKNLGIEVYFDDSPSGVSQLRAALPDVKFIRYAGRVGKT